VTAAAHGERSAEHHHDGECEPERGQRFAEERLREDRDEHRRDVEQRGRARHPRPGDPELVGHLE
jgi:hypothetical protein